MSPEINNDNNSHEPTPDPIDLDGWPNPIEDDGWYDIMSNVPADGSPTPPEAGQTGDKPLAKIRQAAVDRLGAVRERIGQIHENGLIRPEAKEKLVKTVKVLGSFAIKFSRELAAAARPTIEEVQAAMAEGNEADLPSAESLAFRIVARALAESAKPRFDHHKRFEKKAEEEAKPGRHIKEVAQTGVPKQHNRSKTGKNGVVTAFRHTKVLGKANRQAFIEQNAAEKTPETEIELEAMLGEAAWSKIPQNAKDVLVEQHWGYIGFDPEGKSEEEVDAKRQSTEEEFKTMLGGDTWSKISDGEKTKLIHQRWRSEGYDPAKQENVPSKREIRKWSRDKRDFRHTALARYADITYLKRNRLTGSIHQAREDYIEELMREERNSYLEGRMPASRTHEFTTRSPHPLVGPKFQVEDRSRVVDRPSFADRRGRDLENTIRATLPGESRLHKIGAKLRLVGPHEERVQRQVDTHMREAERIAQERFLSHSTTPNPETLNAEVSRARMEAADLRIGELLHVKLVGLAHEEEARIMENERRKREGQAPILEGPGAETYKKKREAVIRAAGKVQRRNWEAYNSRRRTS